MATIPAGCRASEPKAVLFSAAGPQLLGHAWATECVPPHHHVFRRPVAFVRRAGLPPLTAFNTIGPGGAAPLPGRRWHGRGPPPVRVSIWCDVARLRRRDCRDYERSGPPPVAFTAQESVLAPEPAATCAPLPPSAAPACATQGAPRACYDGRCRHIPAYSAAAAAAAVPRATARSTQPSPP